MVAPLHFGLEHPSLTWLVVAGLLAFVAGLGVNLYRSTGSAPASDDALDDEPAE